MNWYSEPKNSKPRHKTPFVVMCTPTRKDLTRKAEKANRAPVLFYGTPEKKERRSASFSQRRELTTRVDRAEHHKLLMQACEKLERYKLRSLSTK